MFWIISILVLLSAGLLTLLPLLRAKSGSVMLGIGLACLVPLIGLWAYTQVGSPDALDVRGAPNPEVAMDHQDGGQLDMQSAIDSLTARLAANPEDVEGWILLSRSFKATQRFPEAVSALESALQVAPDNPYVMAELAEARLFTSERGKIDDRVIPMLERALQLDPEQQKALWLMGITSAEAGNDEAAIAYWEKLVVLMGADEPVAQSIQSQINEAKSRLGMEVGETPAAPPEIANEPGIRVIVSATGELPDEAPASAVLYVSVRNAAMAAGPPLGALRVASPGLPIKLKITDNNSMMQNMLISSVPEVTLQARLSLSGTPEARSGDWQSAAVKVNQDSDQVVSLVLDHRVE